jgi:hypothetical protein
MMKKNNLDIAKSTMKYLILCIGTIVVFVLVGLYPMYRYNIYLAGEITNIKDQIEELKEMGPVYLKLQKAMESKDSQILPNPKKTTITREEAAKFPNVFRNIAGKSGLVAISVTPDSSNTAGSSNFVLNNAVLKGNFTNFRKMLIALSAIPYLDKIEDISISQRADSMEYKIQIWLALGD